MTERCVADLEGLDALPAHIPDPMHPPSGSPSTDSTDTTLTLPTASANDILELPSAAAVVGQSVASIFTQQVSGTGV